MFNELYCEVLHGKGRKGKVGMTDVVPLQSQPMRHKVVSKGNTSPLLTRGKKMSLNVQFYKVHNHMTNEDIVMSRIVNQQVLDFNGLCEYLADGSTVTAADVSAVMKLIELRLPLILGLNAKVICSPEGLTFRPKVSGSITQSELKKKLEAKLAADPTLDIDVNRDLEASDLSINDLTASIAIELPKKWDERFKAKAEFKRVNNANGNDNGNVNDNANPNPNDNQGQGGNTGGNTGGGGDDQGGGSIIDGTDEG